MLKITVFDTPTERRWILAGRLMGPWVKELRIAWKKMCPTHPDRASTIDLNEVTFVDKGGERLLRVMARKGARLIANGVYMKHLVEELKNTGKREARKLPFL